MSNAESAFPTNIDLNKAEAYLEITWKDGRVCRYPLAHLREACPCVQCRGGHEFMGAAHNPKNILVLKPVRSYAIEQIDVVGNYAIQPLWDDGHQTGIYSWEYLYNLCPPQND